MGSKYEQKGDVLTHANGSGSDIAADDVVVTGDIVAVALVDIADDESGSVAIEGVFEQAKVSGTAWVQGDSLDWDASEEAWTKGLTGASGDVTGAGIAAADAASGDTTGSVRLTPGSGTAA